MGRVRSKRDIAAVKPTLILNATPLIYLAKIGLSDKLRFVVPYRLVTTKEVYSEVVNAGNRKGVREIQRLNDLFETGIIKIEKVDDYKADVDTLQALKESGIHRGEERVISLALRLRSIVVMDDQKARQVAKILGVKVTGTPHLVLHMVNQNLLTKDKAKKAVDMMIETGWRCSPSHYAAILKLIDEIG